MSSEPVVAFCKVWKKYSRQQVVHNSLREQFVGLFSRKSPPRKLLEGEFWALRDVDFAIRRGECVGLAGPNGSGKSTILKLIANVTCPTSGVVQMRNRVAPLIELGAGFHPDLSGVENIFMNGTILGLTIREVREKVPAIVDFSGLGDFINAPVKKYSSGMYLRLAFSIAVHSPAETYLFDEVLAVGDEEFQRKCNERIAGIRQEGKTIVIVSHDREAMTGICDRIITLDHGSVVASS